MLIRTKCAESADAATNLEIYRNPLHDTQAEAENAGFDVLNVSAEVGVAADTANQGSGLCGSGRGS